MIERVKELNRFQLENYHPYSQKENEFNNVEFFTLTPVTSGPNEGWDKVTYYVLNKPKK